MKDKELRKLQLIETDILKEFIRTCDELGCEYSLDAGTLLGCIRHKGFIPWDDDIDVWMPRKDYEKYIENAQKLLDKKFFIQNYKTDPNFSWAFTKIRNSNTTFIEPIHKNVDINHGIYIDIFPFDNYDPNKKIKNGLINFKRMLLNIQLMKFRPRDNKNIKVISKIKNCLLRIPSNIIYGRKSLSELNMIFDEIAKESYNDDTEYIANLVDPINRYKPNYYSKTLLLSEKIYMTFEDILAKVPTDYDQVLKIKFGDYMKLPPREEQVSKHNVIKIDFEKSYKYYDIKEENK